MSLIPNRPVFGLTPLRMSVALLAMAGFSQFSRADQIPYAPIGTPNPVTYSFHATGTGPIDAYFAGFSAAYTETLGMEINGVPTGITGLTNQTSTVGEKLNLGNAVAGDTLTFFIYVDNTAGYIYSNPALNGPYDINGSDGHNHIYATPYTGDGPVIGSIPTTNATFVGFEDLPFPNSDFDYNDTTYVFTNVTVPDGGMTVTLLGSALAGLD
jgi:hypothetical protein